MSPFKSSLVHFSLVISDTQMSVGLKMSNKCLLSVSIHVARPPRITAHPQLLKDAVPGETLALTIQASGTEPLNYQWEIRTGDGSGTWQLCDVERLPGANSSTFIIPSVQKLNEGYYRCVVSNTVGSQTSGPVNLNIGIKDPDNFMQWGLTRCHINLFLCMQPILPESLFIHKT